MVLLADGVALEKGVILHMLVLKMPVNVLHSEVHQAVSRNVVLFTDLHEIEVLLSKNYSEVLKGMHVGDLIAD